MICGEGNDHPIEEPSSPGVHTCECGKRSLVFTLVEGIKIRSNGRNERKLYPGPGLGRTA